MGKAVKLLYTCAQGLRSKTTPQAQLYNLNCTGCELSQKSCSKSNLELDVVMCARSTQEAKSQGMASSRTAWATWLRKVKEEKQIQSINCRINNSVLLPNGNFTRIVCKMFFFVFKFMLFPYSLPVPGTFIFLISKYLLLEKKNGRKWLMPVNNRNGPGRRGLPRLGQTGEDPAYW